MTLELGKEHRVRIRFLMCMAFCILTMTILCASKAEAVTQREEEIYWYLVNENGLPLTDACGILANIQTESRCREDLHGPGGRYGLFQFDKNIVEVMKTFGGGMADISSWKTQVYWAVHSIGADTAYKPYARKALVNLWQTRYTQEERRENTPQNAAVAAEWVYQNLLYPGKPKSGAKSRAAMAENVYWPYFAKNAIPLKAVSRPGKVVLTCDPPKLDASMYTILRAESPEGPYKILITTGNRDLYYEDTTGVRGKRYYYKVEVPTHVGTIAGRSGTVSGICLPSLNDAKCTAVLLKDRMTYTGKPCRCGVKVTYGKKVLTEGKHYTVTYGQNIKAGKAYVKISGKGCFSGKIYKSFKIVKAKQTIRAQDQTVIFSSAPVSFGASAPGKLTAVSSNPKVAVISDGRIILKRCGYCDITYHAAETANYLAASRTIRLRIRPERPSSVAVNQSGAGKLRVRWIGSSVPGGYWVRYSRTPDFKKYKTVILHASRGTETVLEGLGAGNVYVKVLAFKKADGKFLFSRWTPTVSARIR